MKPETGWSGTVQAPTGKDCPSNLSREHMWFLAVDGCVPTAGGQGARRSDLVALLLCDFIVSKSSTCWCWGR